MQQWFTFILAFILMPATSIFSQTTELSDTTSTIETSKQVKVKSSIRKIVDSHYSKDNQNNDEKKSQKADSVKINTKHNTELFNNSHQIYETIDTTHSAIEDYLLETSDNDSLKTEAEFDVMVDTDALKHGEDSTALNTDSTITSDVKIHIDYHIIKPAITINDNEGYAREPVVKIMLDTPHAVYIRISNSENFSNIQWIDALPEKQWTLDEGDGERYVYLQVMYPDSTISEVVSDDIMLVMTPPEPYFVVTPDSAIAGETMVSVDASNSQHNFELYCRWDWENDGRFDTYWTIARKDTHIYKQGGGKHSILLEVKDSAGWSKTMTRDITVYSCPVAEFRYTQDFLNPLSLAYDASASNDFEDGNNLLFRWNLNTDSTWDTKWSNENSISYIYDYFQTITIALQVKDSNGMTDRCVMKIENKFYNMVFVLSGGFNMGNNVYEVDERPMHTIFLDDFWIDKYPVTNGQYALFLNQQRKRQIDELIDLTNEDVKIYVVDSTYIAADGFEQHPVVQVTWYGAQAYAAFYGKELPTEAEWEKAARGTDERVFPWGDEINGQRANYWDSGDPFNNHTTPVGFFNGQLYKDFQTVDSPSPFGVYDLVDNVREWCADWYQWNYYAISPSQNPNGPNSGNKRVVRGGGFLFHDIKLRTTFRSSFEPTMSNGYTGFRCVIGK